MMPMEVANLCKDEKRRRDFKIKPHSRQQRRPAAITAAIAPRNPRRSPLNVRHPDPAVGIVISPAAVVVACPRPRLVALPIPAAVRPYPLAIAVRSPTGCDAARMPAAAVVADINPNADIT